MKFSIPLNWQTDFLTRLTELPPSSELYGKLQHDFVGGGKHSCQVPYVSKRRIAAFVKEIHRKQLEFSYLLNAACMNNLEWTRRGQREITRLMDWLVDIGVDSVTVATPYLIQLIKKRFPGLRVNVSILAGANSITRAEYWDSLGADKITLLNTDLNRHFSVLKKIRSSVKCKLQLIANVNCLYRCPLYFYHNSLSAHSSQSSHPSGGFVIDYCRLTCRYRQIINPEEVIRSPWIRPEDVHYYEDLGIDSLKLIDRGMATDAVFLIVKAYSQRRYDGNLIDLFPNPNKSIIFRGSNPVHKIRYFFRPLSVNLFKLVKIRQLFSEIYYIDNRKLDGFLEYFLHDANCHLRSCDECGYCGKIAAKVVSFDPALQKKSAEKYRECLDDLATGGMFSYFRQYGRQEGKTKSSDR